MSSSLDFLTCHIELVASYCDSIPWGGSASLYPCEQHMGVLPWPASLERLCSYF